MCHVEYHFWWSLFALCSLPVFLSSLISLHDGRFYYYFIQCFFNSASLSILSGTPIIIFSVYKIRSTHTHAANVLSRRQRVYFTLPQSIPFSLLVHISMCLQILSFQLKRILKIQRCVNTCRKKIAAFRRTLVSILGLR